MTPEEQAARAMWIAEPAEFLSRSLRRSEADWAEIVGDVKARYIRLAAAGVAAAIAAEREACAKIAENDTSFMMLQDFGMQSVTTQVRVNIAAAIRARGE